jgi:hypothetical protein
MDKAAAKTRLVAVVRALAAEKRAELDRLKEEHTGLARPDFIWHYLLQSFSTMGRASGWHGLIGNQDNYRRVTYTALAALTREDRVAQVRQVCQVAGVRMPDKKAEYILGCFDYVTRLGGPEAAKASLLAQPGREAKIAFLQSFPGIGPKYARNIMMDVYHEDFRDSIALDVRIKAISEALGLSFASYTEEERFYLDVARKADRNGWELDHLLFNFRPEVEARLSVSLEGPDQDLHLTAAARVGSEFIAPPRPTVVAKQGRSASGGVQTADRIVPEDPANPGYDVLIGKLGARTHYIHCALAATPEPLTPAEIGERAERLARAGGYPVKPTTFSSTVTSSHLNSMRNKPGRGFAGPLGDGRWQLSQTARRRIESARGQ